MLGLPDVYTIKARLLPALIAAMPGLVLAAVMVSWQQLGLSHAVGAGAAFLLFYVFSDLAQQHGKRLEKCIFERMGGKPSTTLLRHRDGRFDAATKGIWCRFVGGQIKQEPPTAEDETANPAGADIFYARCGDWLRDQMRDYKRFKLLFETLVRYGFRRNLLGLKKTALALTAIIVVACAIALWFRLPISPDDHASMRLIYVLVVAAMQAAYFLFVVNEKAAMQAAHEYGEQLLLGCDALISGPPPAAKKPARKEKGLKEVTEAAS
jgi:hypothetical protein